MPCKWLQLQTHEMTEYARLSRLSINAVTSVVAEAPNKSNDLKSVSACLGGNISGLELPKVTVESVESIVCLRLEFSMLMKTFRQKLWQSALS